MKQYEGQFTIFYKIAPETVMGRTDEQLEKAIKNTIQIAIRESVLNPENLKIMIRHSDISE